VQHCLNFFIGSNMMALQDLLETTIEPPELYEDASGQGRFRSRRKRRAVGRRLVVADKGKNPPRRPISRHEVANN
jgi:hypothetical protein